MNAILLNVASLTIDALGALARLQSLAIALILSTFWMLALRAALLLALERGQSGIVRVWRVLSMLAFLGLGALYGVFARPLLVWDLRAIIAAVGVGLLVSGTVWLRIGGRQAASPGPLSLLAQAVLLLFLLLLACLTLMRAGFVALTEDRPVLLLEVTGETAARTVRWAAPDQEAREEVLTTHRVVFRTPDGALVGEAWLFGDEVAVKGRVLRLSPVLSAAGIPNLFELSFAHNGYTTPERHNAYPHLAVALRPTGPLAVHRLWRPLQRRLLDRWEKGTTSESPWAVRSVTTESTYFPLADAAGRPLQKTFKLVLTPGGLTAG